MPQVLLREFFRFASPRRSHDIVHVQFDTGENPIDFVVSVRVISGTFVRKFLRIIFGLICKIFLKDLRKILFKEFPVLLVIEMLAQKPF